MNSQDISNDITKRLADVLTKLKEIRPATESYLTTSDVRPSIEPQLLAILYGSLELCEMFNPVSGGHEFQFELRCTHANPEWDFYPWMVEKLSALRDFSRRLVGYWLLDPDSIEESRTKPKKPRDYLHTAIVDSHHEAELIGKTIFGEVCQDHISVLRTLRS